jgi:hypothetical protein
MKAINADEHKNGYLSQPESKKSSEYLKNVVNSGNLSKEFNRPLSDEDYN